MGGRSALDYGVSQPGKQLPKKLLIAGNSSIQQFALSLWLQPFFASSIPDGCSLLQNPLHTFRSGLVTVTANVS